ncbi:MAG: (Fe-S)-binding protein [Gracilibacteraceae bacterium]|jgi:Fe-S oxidoreductase|nr:(Fe-S)-binding protein [Gracilibacteraceae bacterium]
MSGIIAPKDLGRRTERLINYDSLPPLPAPYDQWPEPKFAEIKPEWREKYCTSLDGCVAIDTMRPPASDEEKKAFVEKFLQGLGKLFSDANNGVRQPLELSFEYCAKCNTCSEACHVFQASGGQEPHRPIFRAEVLRKLYRSHFSGMGALRRALSASEIDATWETIGRLGELAYRCNLCRRCAQACPLGLDNSLFAKEIRKIFSQEMGLAPTPLHDKGSMLQLKVGSSTGIGKAAFLDMVEFLEDDTGERIGQSIKIPVDKKGADILLYHNAGEFVAWPENPAAYAILFNKAGLDWTLSSEVMTYDSVNYGIWYDDIQAKKIALKQIEAMKALGIRRVVVGECGHAHKAALIVSDRLIRAEERLPVESSLPLLAEMVTKKQIRFDPAKNPFPVTLHDPCNLVRQMGVVKPQRDILQALCPAFREMTPHGVDNYCCGGGSGFAIMNSPNFSSFRNQVSGRMKFAQILNAFTLEMTDQSLPKYVCAPCSNCKGTLREIFEVYKATEQYNLQYGGLVEIMVNAMAELKQPYLEFLQ